MKIVFILIPIIIAVATTIIVVPLVCCQHEEDWLLVTTKSGTLTGTQIESDISNFVAFFSVPYAKPPIGDLRFKPPQPVAPWEGTRDATREGPACIQPRSIDDSEDCLTLNIYTSDTRARGRAVLVWIHGGALEFGTGRLGSYGPHYFMQHDLVVVTVQFRLGILGFLNLGTEDAAGNMGLKDTVQALKWIRDNIEYFGGDPQAVTISGQSSGGIMAHTLLLSRMAEGLFNQIIIQSGTALSYRFYHNDASLVVPKIIQKLNATFTTEQLLNNLKTLDVAELLDIQAIIKDDYMEGYAQYYPFAISIENTYDGQESLLLRPPLEIMNDGDYIPLPMMIGYNSDEGIRLEIFMDILHEVDENFYVVVPTDLFDIDDRSDEKLEVAETIKRFYFGEHNLSRETFPDYAQLCTDSWYAHITDYVVRLQNVVGYTQPTYYYVFGVDGAYNLKINSDIQSPGPSHSDEIGYMWKMDDLSHVQAEDDFSDVTRERMVTMWTYFIKYGNPTPAITTLLPVSWDAVEYPNIKYLLINQTLSVEEDPLRERMLFWQQLYGYDII